MSKEHKKDSKMREVRCSTSVHHIEDKRGELEELDVSLNWEPVEFTECIE